MVVFVGELEYRLPPASFLQSSEKSGLPAGGVPAKKMPGAALGSGKTMAHPRQGSKPILAKNQVYLALLLYRSLNAVA